MNFRSCAALLALLAATGCDLGTQNRSGGGTEGVGLSGVLLLPDGSPAVGARAYAYALTDDEASLDKVGVKFLGGAYIAQDSALSDANGGFHFARLAPGTYNVEALRAGDTALGWFTAAVVYSGGKQDLGPIPQPP